MISNKKNVAFSLTELLLVLAIIAVIFAVSAPIMVKSKVKSEATLTESVWNYVNGSSSYDSYYDPGIPSWSSSLFIGLVPSLNVDLGTPAKVIIKANKSKNSDDSDQNQIQFRYGPGEGSVTGVLHMDDSGNFGLTSGGRLWKHQTKEYSDNGIDASSNTILGDMNVVGSRISYSTILGTNLNGSVSHHYATLIGSGDFSQDGSINIGASNFGSLSLGRNVYSGTSSRPRINVGQVYPLNIYSNSIVLGYGAAPYQGASFNYADRSYDNTLAIGYNSCYKLVKGSSVDGQSTSLTCIGGLMDPSADNKSLELTKEGDYVFIGQPSTLDNSNFPKNKAVLEIYSPNADTNYSARKTNGSAYNAKTPSVILNSNLVVKGGFYINDDSGTSTTPPLALQNMGYINRATEDFIQVRYSFGIPWSPENKGYTDVVRYSTSPSPLSSSMMFNDTYKSGGWCTYPTMFSSGANYSRCLDNTVSSDIRLKENITPNSDGLEKILKIDSYNYYLNDDPDSVQHTGVMAQSLKNIFPASVTTDENGFYKIRWDEMFFAIINSVKQLSAKLEKIASDVSHMADDLKIIKTEQKDIKKQITVLNSRVYSLERQTRR